MIVGERVGEKFQEGMEKFQRGKRAGPVADQPSRLRTPPSVGTPLQAAGLPGQRHPLGKSSHPRGGEKRASLEGALYRVLLRRAQPRINQATFLSPTDRRRPLAIHVLLIRCWLTRMQSGSSLIPNSASKLICEAASYLHRICERL